jgi:hypothetical protein
MPFSIDPLPIPAGHPESEMPLSVGEERRFEAALGTVHERTQADYGVPVDGTEPTARVPESLQETLELATDDLDELLAVLTRYVQLREGVRETNEPVSVRAVDDLLETWYDTRLPGTDSDTDDEADRDVPSRETLAEIRDRSPLFELSVDTERNETVMRLTETGERTSEPDTGTVQAAGTAAHDDAIGRVEAALTRAGFLVAPVRQDGSAQPDAWAIHPEAEVPLALEVETTTHTKPAKVLTNLARAQEHGVVPVFLVPPGDEDVGAESAICQRVGNILDDPVKARKRGDVELYVGTDHVTFNGGAEADNGVTAVRPVASETDSPSNRTQWRRDDGVYVLTDEAGTEHAQVADVDAAPKEQFPATYSIDRDSGTVTVSVPGELPRSYESKSAFREDWVTVKRPVLPESDLPAPEYNPETYAIGVLRDSDRDSEAWDGDVAIYEDGALHPVQRLTQALQTGELRPARSSPDDARDYGQPATVTADGGSREQGSAGEGGDAKPVSIAETNASSPDSADAGVEAFASKRLVEEEEGNVIPFRAVYDVYEAFVEENEFEPKSDTHFTPAIKEHIEVESKSKWFDGKTQQCYIGVGLVDSGDQRGEPGE